MKCLLLLRSLWVPLPIRSNGRRCVSIACRPPACCQRRPSSHVSPAFATPSRTANTSTSRRTPQTRLSSTSSFEAPEPPQSHGQPVFPDVPIRNNAATKGTNAFLRNDDPNAVFVVNGSSRGIGLQFVQTLTRRTRGKIVACCRSPDTAHHLQALAARHQDRIRILTLDMERQSTIDDVAYTLAKEYHRADALFNVAGILGDGVTTSGPERTLAAIERGWLEKTLAVNVVGPLMLTKALSPLMRTTGRKAIRVNNPNAMGESEQVQIHLPNERPPTVVVSLSARVGSISDNRMGGWYSYRLSKSALNQATKTLGLELKRQGTWIVALHPGTTDTDLSKPFQKNVQKERLFPVDFTVNRLMDVVESMDDEHSGGFFDWAGKAIPF